MPVPVPLSSKQPAHPVIKINHLLPPDSKSSVFQHLTHSLPLPPQGPPPSFATREEWISSLPSWRRNKPRRIWEDDSGLPQGLIQQGFSQGLTAAANASVIKGQLAQACIPPARATQIGAQSLADDMYLPQEDLDEDMSGYPASMQDWQSEDDAYMTDVSSVDEKYYDRATTGSPSGVAMDYRVPTRAIARSYSSPAASGTYGTYEKGAFSPVFEDLSPEVAGTLSPELTSGVEPGSSPIGPATPFADFVDNAFAEVQLPPALQRNRDVGVAQAAAYAVHDGYHASCYQCQTYQTQQPVQQAPVVESVVTPVATEAYKKLAAPLSEWIVGFVWKVCTTGMRLSPEYAQPMAFIKHYPASPPSHLVASTHSMLLSTLLQPSAIFLALWYIVRLPVFFSPVGLGPEHAKEMRFRAELLGEAHLGIDRDIIESYAPFRLILLGCMFANKWLDDHTFSNKTWHTISNVPIHSLNRLESLALDIFQYDLSISPQQWSGWLSDLMAYHQALSSPVFPQPISRPSSSPHNIVRQAIEMLINVRSIDCSCGSDGEGHPGACGSPPQPVFVSLEDRKEKVEYGQNDLDDVLEIDLDEDGPLREEYMPRRRINSRPYNVHAEPFVKSERALPPPAKWSPAADEPISRDHARVQGQYVAPIAHNSLAPLPPYQPLPPPPLDIQRTSWPYMMRQEVSNRPTVFAPPPFQAPVPGFEYGYPVPSGHGHARSHSHSLSYHQVIADPVPGRLRSYSQSQFEHPYSDIRGPEIHYIPPPPVTSHWTAYDRIGFPTSYDRPYGLPNRPSLKA